MRIGTGFDVHRLAYGRPLILGGVNVPYEKGLLGHSDADVLAHAIMDAMLGALVLGDLGQHFPDTDPAYAGISSLKLMEKVSELCRKHGYRIVNADAVIIAERPRLAPYIKAMQENIARAAGTLPENIGVKATTAEGLGFCGREEGIAAQAVVLLKKD
ncbi:MAG: 2-C-methyl-D-erythritol 2,4-cyclodiphosphate synthase [Bacillota bacterium]|jgi:2-C-methyl-D-erythritol 2,4-cyclodiphosphate synthase|nr:2-C-methyl-D-erythritol 2,4-cyclodiphosphate synthase [Bacillota bacterium]HHU29762.1 2-C-methyl-D-erythritol 2,4-cyclodiphosphate synthase [Bacillota bacterium]